MGASPGNDGGRQGRHRALAEINITPLVDVMLVVLIIFIVVTPMLQKGVGVQLPQARNVKAVSEDKTKMLMVVVKEDGTTLVGSRIVDAASLARALQQKHDENPARQLQIKADRNVAYGEVKKIIRAGRQAGFGAAALIAEEIHGAAGDDGTGAPSRSNP